MGCPTSEYKMRRTCESQVEGPQENTTKGALDNDTARETCSYLRFSTHLGPHARSQDASKTREVRDRSMRHYSARHLWVSFPEVLLLGNSRVRRIWFSPHLEMTYAPGTLCLDFFIVVHEYCFQDFSFIFLHPRKGVGRLRRHRRLIRLEIPCDLSRAGRVRLQRNAI
jgi:hypothetical protein